MPNVSISLGSTGSRVAVIVAAIVLFLLAFVCARWLIGTTIASRAVYKEIAELAVAVAPSDPQTHLVHATLLEKTFFPEDLPRSLAEFETAVALSPNDYVLWLELGRARARSGDNAGAEAALRRSLELAPNYSRVIWNLGNFLLRRNNTDEAFALIRRAADSDPQYSNPAITNAWQVFQGDYAKVRELAGDSVNLKASLASFLAREKRFDEASEIWASLPQRARDENLKSNGDEIMREMLAAKRFRDAVRMTGGRFQSEVLFNGGFETPFTLQSPSDFEWRIGEGAIPQIGVDPGQKHEGNVSLALIFSGNETAFRNLSQTVAGEPGRGYTLRGFYRSELKTASTVKWSIASGADGKVIAESPALDAQTDWKEFIIAFTLPADADGVQIILKRADCQSSYCPISGRLWLDGMRLEHAGR